MVPGQARREESTHVLKTYHGQLQGGLVCGSVAWRVDSCSLRCVRFLGDSVLAVPYHTEMSSAHTVGSFVPVCDIGHSGLDVQHLDFGTGCRLPHQTCKPARTRLNQTVSV